MTRVALLRFYPCDRLVVVALTLLTVVSVLSPNILSSAFPVLPISDQYDTRWQLNDHTDPFGEQWETKPDPAAGGDLRITVPYSRGPDRTPATRDDIDLITGWRLRLYQHCRFLLLSGVLCLAVSYLLVRFVPLGRTTTVETAHTLLLGLAVVGPLWAVCYERPTLLLLFEDVFAASGLPSLFSEVSVFHWLALYAAASIALWSVRRHAMSRLNEDRAQDADELSPQTPVVEDGDDRPSGLQS